jgi:hypothetical protein
MTCMCGKPLGDGKKDGQKKTCECGRTWVFTYDEEFGRYWQLNVTRFAPEDRPNDYLNNRIRTRIAEAQSVESPRKKGRRL